MTTTTSHGQVPDTLIDLIDAYAETRHRCGGIYNAKTEAARKAVIEDLREALGGVQALSAAPAIGDELRDTLAAVSAAIAERDDRAAQKMIREILAASTTPPAEQQAQPGAVYAELPQPDSWFHFTAQFWENKLSDFADRIHALRIQAAPKAAPGEQNNVPAEWLEQAYREGWAACRDAETIGEEAEDWAFGNSTANSRMIDAQQAAPQQEAQEPAARYTIEDVRKARSEGYRNGVESSVPSKITKEMRHAFREKYKEGSIWTDRLDIALEGMLAAAPQPTPVCHHRPPCDECAAIAAQGDTP